MKVAEGFAGIRNGRGYENAIILSGWVPMAFEGILRAPDYASLLLINAIANSKLPLYKELIFNNQAEVALKGGLLPHYLLGYHYWEGSQVVMELNPALFATNVHWSGDALPVDQGDFGSVLQSTFFERCFSLDELSRTYVEGRLRYHLDWESCTLC
ncbi:hypothetical protein [Chitinophaga rhizophila]|uniref:Uncharacterized protein n=1 Tax=Chitinophaga rhizophila TaxID=2866212 RepID=A0ABS7G8B8_9BACT|nr:hypothetical protein [Chitinophaga rhizophila]MBW8683550.1 hypothetical protein [Chitinophaga rhizophila]